MRKVILIITFLLCMVIFTLIIMMIGFKQNEIRLLYLGLGVPLWLYLIFVYLKFLNKITVEKEFTIVKNPVFGKEKVEYREIEYWKEIQPPARGNLYRTLILKTYQNKRKITILEDVDCMKFETLRLKLKSEWKSKEKV